MNIRDLKESLEYLFKAELTAFIWGDSGIGKSEIMKQYAEGKGWKFFPFYLGTQSDTGDILGLYDFVKDKQGNTVAVANAYPKWIVDMIQYCNDNPESGTLIFLDEFNRARRDILQGCFSLALDKTFHTLKLPKNCHIIAAGNPPTDEYFTTDVNETALMSRFVHVKLEPTMQEWVEFAKSTKIDPTLIEFIKNQPQLLEEAGIEFPLPVKVRRRSWSRLNKLMELETPHHLLEQLMQGIIGLERTVAYQQFLKDQDKPLTAKEVYTGKRRGLLTKWSNPEDTVASLLNLTCDNLQDDFKERDAKEDKADKDFLKAKEKEQLMSFLTLIPKDIAYPFIHAMTTSRNEVFRNFFLDKDFEGPMTDLVRCAKGRLTEKDGVKDEKKGA